MIEAVFWLVQQIINLILIILVINVVISWLVGFDIVSRRNRFVATTWDVTSRLTDPLLRPIRNVIPTVGGLDFAPMVLILGLGFISRLIPG
ncbi:MAG: YggT family protein [Alphaproteobacteria bacterium]|nr:YggT family protein [Alphaproteobacteria bacterium]